MINLGETIDWESVMDKAVRSDGDWVHSILGIHHSSGYRLVKAHWWKTPQLSRLQLGKVY